VKRLPDTINGVRGPGAWILLAFFFATNTIQAHSASDAYLTLTAGAGHEDTGHEDNRVVLQGQWDIALRDLDFALRLDDAGNGRLTWGDVRSHRAAIEHYAYANLAFDAGAGNTCTIRPTRQLIDNHADGAYAALFFEVVCARKPAKLTLSYQLFFAIDPSHRGIFMMRSGANAATAVLSPENAMIDLAL
jgi:hypothetical protein